MGKGTALVALALLGIFACTRAQESATTLASVGPSAPTRDYRADYLKEAETKLGQWQEILGNLKANQNMFPVHSDTYKKRGEQVQFLESQMAEAQLNLDRVKTAGQGNWHDHQPALDAKLNEMKEIYYRPAAE